MTKREMRTRGARQRAPRADMWGRGAAFILSLAALLWLWHTAAARLSPLVLPSPAATWQRLQALLDSGAVWMHLVISFRRTVAGFAAAYALALVLAVCQHRWRWVRHLLQPWLTAVQMVPTIVWLILSVLWFGIAREATPVFVVFVVCLPVVFVQLREGLTAIPAELRDLAALEPMGVLAYTRHVYWPALQPFLLAAATLGFSFAWRAVVISEFVASNSGLGYQLSRAYHNLVSEEVFAWTVVLVALMWLWQ
jgi:NitT/TauT family transport system permease protein